MKPVYEAFSGAAGWCGFSPAPFAMFSLSLGLVPYCLLGMGVSAEQFESHTQLLLILVWFKRQSTRNESVQEPKRLWNMDTKLISFVSFTQQLHRLILIFKRWDTKLFPLLNSKLRSLNYSWTVLRILFRRDMKAQILLCEKPLSISGEQNSENWLDFFSSACLGGRGRGFSTLIPLRSLAMVSTSDKS